VHAVAGELRPSVNGMEGTVRAEEVAGKGGGEKANLQGYEARVELGVGIGAGVAWSGPNPWTGEVNLDAVRAVCVDLYRFVQYRRPELRNQTVPGCRCAGLATRL
jgi:hypothetical protein